MKFYIQLGEIFLEYQGTSLAIKFAFDEKSREDQWKFYKLI